MFDIDNGHVSIAGVVERCFNGNPYTILVREKRGEETRELPAEGTNLRGGLFYVGYSPDAITRQQRQYPVSVLRGVPERRNGRMVLLDGRVIRRRSLRHIAGNCIVTIKYHGTGNLRIVRGGKPFLAVLSQ
jgi:hypothetical protein